MSLSELIEGEPVPCKDQELLSEEKIEEYLLELPSWKRTVDGKGIEKSFSFKDFKGALAFANEVGALAEAVYHHPDLMVSWGKVGVSISSHSVGGLSVNDFILAGRIERLGLE